MKKISSWLPWLIVVMAFFATGLSFLDRQVLSITIIKIKEDFPVSDIEYGFINTAFLISYAVMFTGGGILIDRYGSRLGLAFSVGIWSIATFFHGFAQNVVQFGIFRFILGLGEGGAFPGAIKAVVEWVPKKRQSLANGIAIGGSAIGAVVAPPLCVYLIHLTGWRGVFFVVGVIGMLWVAAWLLLFPKSRPLKQNTTAENNAETEKKIAPPRFFDILKIKEVWIFVVMRFLLDPIFYFYMFWIPKYLNEARGDSLDTIGQLFWIPFLALGVSNIFGGYLSDEIYKKTGNLNFARKIVMGVAAVLTMSALFVRYAPSSELAILYITIAVFAHGLWITNYITSISDIFGKSITSTVIGLSGTAGAISSLVLNPLMGLIIARYSYDPIWIYSGIMYSVAFVAFVVFIPKIRLLSTGK